MPGTRISTTHKQKIDELRTLIRELREMRSWNATRLAEKAGVGQTTVTKFEDGGSTHPSLPLVLKLASAFEIPASKLLDEVGL